MTQHLIPIKSAFITFLVLSQLITIPLLIRRYNKDGAMTFWKVAMEYSFIFYILSAFFLTLLPLPSKDLVAALTGPRSQLIPFQFITDIMHKSGLIMSQPHTYLAALRSPVFLQVIFNVIMLIPFGIYLRHYFRKPIKTVLIYSFLLSLLFEITQLTGIYGYYARSYRLFDVDDLILNTLGGIIGFYISPLVMYLFPSRDEIDRRVIIKSKEIPFLRRAIAYGMDATIIKFILDLLLTNKTNDYYIIHLLMIITLSCIYYVTNGLSLGMRLMKLRITSNTTNKMKLSNSIFRLSSFILFFNIIPYFVQEGFNAANNNPDITIVTLVSWLAVILIYYFMILLHVLINGIYSKRPLVHERISNTHLVSTL